MPDNYLPIESSCSDKSPEVKKVLSKYSICLLILIIATFLAGSIIVLLHGPNGNRSATNHANSTVFKSFAVQSSSEPFKAPIGGRLGCTARLLIKSPTSPTDANQVRPADIKYIAAMGDSLSTGFISYTNKTGIVDDKMRNIVGNSFIMGGDGDMESHLTLANVIRHLNPSLSGFSTGAGMNETQTNLNVAYTGVWADDMQRQARELIRRLGKYPAQSIKEDWKLINIFTGTRDISGFCLGHAETDKYEFKWNLTEAISILQSALPKLIISIIGPANLNFMFRAGSIIKQTVVPCKVFDFDMLGQRRVEQFREAINEIVLKQGMKLRKDQVVISQHIFDDLWEPLRKKNGSFNTDFYATDGFHLSNYGNSLVAKQLWNQLVSSENRKITTNAMMNDESPELICPEFRCPFIRTPSNGISCKLSEENVVT